MSPWKNGFSIEIINEPSVPDNIVGNNSERGGGESILSSQIFPFFKSR